MQGLVGKSEEESPRRTHTGRFLPKKDGITWTGLIWLMPGTSGVLVNKVLYFFISIEFRGLLE